MAQDHTFQGKRGEYVLSTGLTIKDVYQIVYDRVDNIRPHVQTDIDALCQRVCCEIEKKLGIYPNVALLKETTCG